MNKLLAALAAVAIACSTAHAQTAPQPDPAAVAAARQLQELAGTRALTALWLQQMEQRFPDDARAILVPPLEAKTGLSLGQKKKQRVDLDNAIGAASKRLHAALADPKLVDEFLDASVAIYAQTYTVDEIRQLIAFYQSPLGKKMLANEPKRMSQQSDIFDRLMVPRLQRVIAELTQQVANQ